MFNLDQAIAEWRRQMVAAGIKTPATLEELENHLREDVEEQRRSGINAQDAFKVAAQRVGPPGALKAEFRKMGGTMQAFQKTLLVMVLRFVGWRDAMPLPSLSDFNANARQSLELGCKEARGFHHDFIGTEHVLLGLLEMKTGIVPAVLQRLGVDGKIIRSEIEKIVGNGLAQPTDHPLPYTPRVKTALALASTQARALKQTHIGTEHLFLGLLMEGGGVAALVLRNLGIEVKRTREELLKELRVQSEQ
jgi:hypothetical protein